MTGFDDADPWRSSTIGQKTYSTSRDSQIQHLPGKEIWIAKCGVECAVAYTRGDATCPECLRRR